MWKMPNILLLAGLGWIVAPAVASAQTAGSPQQGAGGSSAIDGLGHAGSGSVVRFPDEVPRGRRLERDQTRQNMSGRNCPCDEKTNPAPSTGEPRTKANPPSEANPRP